MNTIPTLEEEWGKILNDNDDMETDVINLIELNFNKAILSSMEPQEVATMLAGKLSMEFSDCQESARKSKAQPPVCCRLSAASYQRCCTKRSSAPGLLHDDAGAALHREQPQPNRYESPCVECH